MAEVDYEQIPDEVIEKITRIVLEELARYLQLVAAGKDSR